MKKQVLAFLSQRVYAQVLRRSSLYRTITQRNEIEVYQLRQFNEMWEDAWTNLAFYRQWKDKNHLPDTITSLRELNMWPILRKRDLQVSCDMLLRNGEKPTHFLKTGGSTGQPLCLGAWHDDGIASSSQWMGRSAYGYYPGIRTFLLWGHEHLYGNGARRRVRILERRMKDKISNICRVSAYDLSAEAMKRAFARFEAYRPDCLIGFSAAVLAFCRVNAARGEQSQRRLQFVLCTAGPLSMSEKSEIEGFFGARVCMEYGSVECSVMGYTEPASIGYGVFWDTHLIQGDKDAEGGCRNIVTRLSPCYVPLIRYDVGDYIDVESDADSHLRLIDVKGRPSDIVRLGDGTAFFGALIGDCVKQVDGVLANQVFVYANGIVIHVTSSRVLKIEDFAIIRNRLEIVVPSLRNKKVDIKSVPSLMVTVGGKIPLVVHRETIKL